MSRFDPSKPVIAQTLLWQRAEQGTWDRYLIREQKNGTPVSSVLTPVSHNLEMCLACLSPELMRVPSDDFEDGEWHCQSCGVTYGIIL